MSDDPTPNPAPGQLDALHRRMDLLERENQRLREKMEPMLGPDNPCFDPRRFSNALQRAQLLVMLPVIVLVVLAPLVLKFGTPFRSALVGWRIGPVPVIDIAGSTSGVPGVGLGIIAVGGAAIGVVALGGGAVGVIAMGGGAVGLIAIGGGAVGIIALGGGACGYIAIGQSAIGYYALGRRAYGKHVLALNRQDQAAIDLFIQFIPGLRAAVTTAMPVIPLSSKDPGLSQ